MLLDTLNAEAVSPVVSPGKYLRFKTLTFDLRSLRELVADPSMSSIVDSPILILLHLHGRQSAEDHSTAPLQHRLLCFRREAAGWEPRTCGFRIPT